MSRLTAAIEAHPVVSWLLSLFSICAGGAQWFMDHADQFAKLTGLVATLLGVAAGWYALRINRRRWQRMERDDIVRGRGPGSF